jgi:hypothetical protein
MKDREVARVCMVFGLIVLLAQLGLWVMLGKGETGKAFIAHDSWPLLIVTAGAIFLAAVAGAVSDDK